MGKSQSKPERFPWSRLFFLLLMGGMLMMLGSLVRPEDAKALSELGERAMHSRSIRTDSQVVGDTAGRMHWTNWVELFGLTIAAASVGLAIFKTAVSRNA